ncbi:MAG: cytochrome c class I [Draconibacterium sp.]|nr:cytochrome c class I [Draconibacterium sp.]
MKNKSFKATSMGALFLVSLSFFSCKDDLMTAEKPENAGAESEVLLKGAEVDLPGRVLASNCFQCHGTNGYAGELKIGEQSASSIISDMNEMKRKDPGKNIMNVHARAYTSEEIKMIGEYISKQKRY